MKCYGLFHGVGNYSTYITNRDIEEFNSIADAKHAFWVRADFDSYYPCVDMTMEMQISFEDPRTDGSDIDFIEFGYPDRIISLGPRGGVKVERC